MEKSCIDCIYGLACGMSEVKYCQRKGKVIYDEYGNNIDTEVCIYYMGVKDI